MYEIESISVGSFVVTPANAVEELANKLYQDAVVSRSDIKPLDLDLHGSRFMKIVAEIARTQKIIAIKLVRQQLDTSLKESKDFVEACVDLLPEIHYKRE